MIIRYSALGDRLFRQGFHFHAMVITREHKNTIMKYYKSKERYELLARWILEL